MKVFLAGNHKYPKRIDNHILAYYADNNVVILRKSVERKILAQNIEISNKQPYLCALWCEMTFNIKALFADYAKAYKISTQQKRAQGVSGFSIFISFIYRLQRRYRIAIEEMTQDFIYNVFKQFNSIKKLMKENLLLCLNIRFYSQYKKFIYIVKSIVDNTCSKETAVNKANLTPGDQKNAVDLSNDTMKHQTIRARNYP
ncbi:MAG: hypothetical protein WC218_09275 [Candidatus Cloacimonadales bacterium]